MISRRTAVAIAESYVKRFSHRGSGLGYSRSPGTVYDDSLYDFLFENNFQAWFCNSVRRLRLPRSLKDWAMRIHTGETLSQATPDWGWDARQKLGQRYLFDLAESFLKWFDTADSFYTNRYQAVRDDLVNALKLDGYVYREGELLCPEADVLNVEEEKRFLHRLYQALSLGREPEAFSFLDLSEKHYAESRWEDCISNSRKFFELVLYEVANRHGVIKTGTEPSPTDIDRPVKVRTYLEREGLIEQKEREAVDKIYGLLSHTGSHPYMAQDDQARLLRQLSLTVSQFVMLRLEGVRKTGNP